MRHRLAHLLRLNQRQWVWWYEPDSIEGRILTVGEWCQSCRWLTTVCQPEPVGEGSTSE